MPSRRDTLQADDEALYLNGEQVVSSVQYFIRVFKEALFRFYKIQTLKRSQDDKLTAFITEQILDARVFQCLLDANKEHSAQYQTLKQATA